MTVSEQILKTREDTKPIYFLKKAGDQDRVFIPQGQYANSWLKPKESGTAPEIGPLDFRARIEPWLAALCQSEHLSLLLGSGLTLAVHEIAIVNTNAKAVAEATTDANITKTSGFENWDFGKYTHHINVEANRLTDVADRGKKKSIEDQIRAGTQLLQGLEILAHKNGDFKEDARKLRENLLQLITDFTDDILKTEQNIILADDESRASAFTTLVSFLMSFASRTGTRERLHLFTTNYDRLIEAGAEVAGMHLLDRFVGNLAPIFRSSRLNLDLHYNPPGIRGEPRYLEGVARFTKLHGSLDWVNQERDIRRIGVPFGAATLTPYWKGITTNAKEVTQSIIYPNASKDRETSEYPFVELFRDFAASACRPNHTLVTYGYGFGDDHINRVIEDMLTIPSTHLVIISYDDMNKRITRRIIEKYENLGRHAQISLLIGDHLGNLPDLVEYYLPKPAIDRATSRMSELLKARWGAHYDGSGQADQKKSLGDNDTGPVGGEA